jgi:hypothetical protein
MKNMKEVQTILTAIHCINYTSVHSDGDIHAIVEYAFRRLFGANTNLLTLCCIGKTKEQIMPEITAILEKNTQYKKYSEDYKK